jgi:predicted DNA-binding transcriptional regulator YafY
MPANSSRDTIARQWELLKRLPMHGSGISMSDLTKSLNEGGFPVSKRQVERDLKALSASFPLVCNVKGTPHGWRWAEGASLDLPGMTLAEALSLRVVEDTLRPLLPASVLRTVEPRFRQAAKKLAALAEGNRNADWADKVRTVSPTLPLVPPQIPATVLECVQDALLANDQIEVEYQAMGKDVAKTLTLNPLGLVQRGPVSYLVATAFTYTDIRLFAVHRMASAKRLYKDIEPRPDFNLDTYIQTGALQFGNGDNIRALGEIEWVARS